MGLFNLFKKSPEPYQDHSTNLIYNLLFCDDLDLYRTHFEPPINYPWDILFSNASTISDLQKIINDNNTEARVKILAYNKQLAIGHKVERKELLGVIVEVGLEQGLDVLASFKDGSARHINHTGHMIIWETSDERSTALTNSLFEAS